jgi:hypothetical protein
MTYLKKDVSRTVELYRVRRPVVVTMLAESKEFEFREKGRRGSFRIPITDVFARAIVMSTEEPKPIKRKRA